MTTILLSGDPGSGKTSVVETLTRTAKSPVFGVLSPAVGSAGGRRGIAVRLIPTGSTRTLAVLARRTGDERGAALLGDAVSTAPVPGAISLGPWDFDPSAIDAANRHLCDYSGASPVVIDEVGPLELRHHGGFLPGLRCVLATASPVILVVRPGLLEVLRSSFGSILPPRPIPSIHPMTMEGPEDISPTVSEILAMLERS